MVGEGGGGSRPTAPSPSVVGGPAPGLPHPVFVRHVALAPASAAQGLPHLLAVQPTGRQLIEKLHVQQVEAVLSVGIQDLQRQGRAED